MSDGPRGGEGGGRGRGGGGGRGRGNWRGRNNWRGNWRGRGGGGGRGGGRGYGGNSTNSKFAHSNAAFNFLGVRAQIDVLSECSFQDGVEETKTILSETVMTPRPLDHSFSRILKGHSKESQIFLILCQALIVDGNSIFILKVTSLNISCVLLKFILLLTYSFIFHFDCQDLLRDQ